MPIKSRAVALAALLAVAACAGPRAPAPGPVATAPPVAPASAAPWDRAVKVGKPYEVFGVWYYPADDRDYEAEGVASWYGPGFHAKSTANGEPYDQDALSAAHTTLPLPSYVEVTNLENGRQLVVRVNDRGPFVGDRLIDLSRRAADILDTRRAGLARVRVRRIVPSAEQVAALRPPARVELATAPPPAVTTRAVAATPVTVAADTAVESVALPASRVAPAGPLVQVAAVADAGRATWLAGELSQYGPARVERTASGLHRVRLGPFATVDNARAALSAVRAAGYGEAWLIGAGTPPPPPVE